MENKIINIYYDNETNLEWIVSDGFAKHNEICGWIDGLRDGFRLPTYDELRTILVKDEENQKIIHFSKKAISKKARDLLIREINSRLSEAGFFMFDHGGMHYYSSSNLDKYRSFAVRTRKDKLIEELKNKKQIFCNKGV